MSGQRLPLFLDDLRLPVIGAPLFVISNPALVRAQCEAGIVGAFPSLNARPVSLLDEWLHELQGLRFAVNLIVHKSNDRLEQDLALAVKWRVPLVITSLGAREDVNRAIHAYGGIVLHDIINSRFAHKAIEKGADGLIAVAAGAGGHAGTWSPFALMQEIRAWFDGPVALSGSIATGSSILAALAMGADFAYIGSAFIATKEANAAERYKQMIVDSSAEDIVYTNLFTGVHGNYLRGSIRNAGFDPEHLPSADPSKMDSKSGGSGEAKVWRDIWGCGQGIGAIHEIPSVAGLVDRLDWEYRAALAKLVVSHDEGHGPRGGNQLDRDRPDNILRTGNAL
ncbi:MAG: nitronate monooxygenase [Acidobacteriota bacterium]|nr:nitronate monooxygenase [Acidobacteriota bacterium]